MSYREFYSFLNHWINRLELRLGRGLVLGFSNAKPLQKMKLSTYKKYAMVCN